MNRLMERAKSAPKRVVFAEGEEPKILRAAAQLADEGIAEPILLGRPEIVKARAASLGLRYVPRVIDPTQLGPGRPVRRAVRDEARAQGHDDPAGDGPDESRRTTSA